LPRPSGLSPMRFICGEVQNALAASFQNYFAPVSLDARLFLTAGCEAAGYRLLLKKNCCVFSHIIVRTCKTTHNAGCPVSLVKKVPQPSNTFLAWNQVRPFIVAVKLMNALLSVPCCASLSLPYCLLHSVHHQHPAKRVKRACLGGHQADEFVACSAPQQSSCLVPPSAGNGLHCSHRRSRSH